MIRRCTDHDFDLIWTIINDGAKAYKGTIPPDRWSEPYMSRQTLQHEIGEGVVFWGYEENWSLVGVMGIQGVQDVTLMRHAYVLRGAQNRGIGGRLLSHLLGQVNGAVLVGTWADAIWAIRFYQKHGFQLVSTAEKSTLLNKYWTIPERQVELSVVLADATWRQKHSASL